MNISLYSGLDDCFGLEPSQTPIHAIMHQQVNQFALMASHVTASCSTGTSNHSNADPGTYVRQNDPKIFRLYARRRPKIFTGV